MKDYYELLGIPRNASNDDIKKAFRRLAHQYHPDKQGGDEKKFKEINEAYQVLSDPKKRIQYDRFGHVFSAGGGPAYGGEGFAGGPFDWSSFGQGFENVNVEFGDLGDFEDLFSSFFGGRAGTTRRSQKGSDVQLMLEVPLAQALGSLAEHIAYSTLVSCAVCGGVGYDVHAGTETCSTCSGTGKIKHQHRSFFGSFTQVKECEKCFGTGKAPKKICSSCRGEGRVRGERDVTVKTGEGVYEGQVIRVAGAGETGVRKNPTGDLYVRVTVVTRPPFRISGSDIITEHNVTLSDLLLEQTLSVPTPDNKTVHIKLSPGFDVTQPVVFRQEGLWRAMQTLGHTGRRGDFVVVLKLKTPQVMGQKAKKLSKELGDELEKEEGRE